MKLLVFALLAGSSLAAFCPQPEPVANGRVECNKDLLLTGSTCTFTCDGPEYKLDNAAEEANGKAVRTCGQNGKWDKTPPICVRSAKLLPSHFLDGSNSQNPNGSHAVAGSAPGTKQLGAQNFAAQGLVPFGVQPVAPQSPQQGSSFLNPYGPQLPSYPYVPQPQPYQPQPQPYQPQPYPYQPQPYPYNPYFPPSPPRSSSSSLQRLLPLLLLFQAFNAATTTTTTTTTTTAAASTTTMAFQGWISHEGCRYKAYRTPATADAARAACTAAGTGATLAARNVKSLAARGALLGRLGFTSADIVWLGVTDDNGNTAGGTVTYADGTTYTALGTDVQVGTTTTSCGAFTLATTAVTFTNCNAVTRFYICEVCP